MPSLSSEKPRALPLLGLLVDGAHDPAGRAGRLFASGFESFEIEFWSELGGVDLGALADSFAPLRAAGASVSSLGVYGNVLDPGGASLAALRGLIEAAGRFGAPIVSCFAGRVPGKSVPDSIPAWKAVFGELADRAAAKGLTIALENCRLGDTWKSGKWNIAINPDAWELLFEALPGAPIGLEWEPAHQALALADPVAQLREWVGRVVHVHGKDARLDRGALAVKGFFAAAKIGRECLPGEGETEWPKILEILASAGYSGCVDLEFPAEGRPEGGDPVREEQRLAASLHYLLDARARLA
jgi:sugar phosphate isomerase/epimerase